MLRTNDRYSLFDATLQRNECLRYIFFGTGARRSNKPIHIASNRLFDLNHILTHQLYASNSQRKEFICLLSDGLWVNQADGPEWSFDFHHTIFQSSLDTVQWNQMARTLLASSGREVRLNFKRYFVVDAFVFLRRKGNDKWIHITTVLVGKLTERLSERVIYYKVK